MKDFEKAADLATQIPLEDVSKIAHMENLLAEKKFDAIIEQFESEDYVSWAFPHIGAAAFLRGRVYYLLKAGEKADADLRLALEFTSDPRLRLSILQTRAANCEQVLKNEDEALAAYQAIVTSKVATGSAAYYAGVKGAARILTCRGQYNEAISMLDYVDLKKLSGSWAGSLWLSRGQTMEAAGREAEALKAYRAVLSNAAASQVHHKSAEEAIKRIME